MEEIEQGNTQEESSEVITNYGEYFKNLRMMKLVDLAYGRKLAYGYMSRDGPLTQTYFIEQITIFGICLLIGISLLFLSIESMLVIAILLGLVYMFFTTISGQRIVKTLERMETPTSKLLHSFNRAYKHIKELEFIERGQRTNFDENIKTAETIISSIQTLDSYDKVCVE